MALGAAVDTKKPLRVAKVDGEVTVVKNIGTPTIYYKTGQNAESVSSVLNDGSLAKGSSLTLTQTTDFIATETAAQVEIRARTLVGGSPSPEAVITGLPNIKEFGAQGDGKTDDTAAINAAIASVAQGGSTGVNGGGLFVPPGAYIHEGVISLKKLTGVRIIGSGGLSGAGALGVGASVAASVFVYEGTGARAWDFRGSVGCGIENAACLARGEGFAGYIWDLEGISVTETTALAHFINASVECGRTLGGTKLIIGASGANLAKCNGMRFDNCIFSSCLYGVAGRAAEGVESVAHTFTGCWFIGNQTKHVVNADDSWVFSGCVAEGLFNNKGEAKKEAGFLGYTEAGITSRGVVLEGCWSSTNEAATRTGVNVEYRGANLVVLGGEYATSETGVYFPEGPQQSVIKGVRFTKLTNGLAIGGKTIDSEIAYNRYTEVSANITDTSKERKGSAVQLTTETVPQYDQSSLPVAGAEKTVKLGTEGISRKITAVHVGDGAETKVKVKHRFETEAVNVVAQKGAETKKPGENFLNAAGAGNITWKPISLSEVEVTFGTAPAAKFESFITVYG